MILGGTFDVTACVAALIVDMTPADAFAPVIPLIICGTFVFLTGLTALICPGPLRYMMDKHNHR